MTLSVPDTPPLPRTNYRRVVGKVPKTDYKEIAFCPIITCSYCLHKLCKIFKMCCLSEIFTSGFPNI